MKDTGRQIRIRRFFMPGANKGIIVPIDHGLANGPIEGIERISQINQWINHRAITGIVAHKGILERLVDQCSLDGLGIIMHLNGCFNHDKEPDTKMILTSAETALRLGADAVSLQLNFTDKNSSYNLKMLGNVVDSAHQFGLPVLAMVYNKNAPDLSLRHLIRASIEMGVDLIKVTLPRTERELQKLLYGVSEHTPVFFAGGALERNNKIVAAATWIGKHGGAGFCVGRNVFQRGLPDKFLTELGNALYADNRASKAMELNSRVCNI